MPRPTSAANRIATLGVLLALLAGCARTDLPRIEPAETAPRELKARVAGLAERLVGRGPVKGLSIALVDVGGLGFSAGFGWADEANAVPARADTVYRAGSIAKLFTATAVMQLAEQGRLDIDQPLRRYLPEFDVQSRFAEIRPITLRDLMSHRAGLPCDIGQGMWSDTPFTTVTARLADQYATHPPGQVTCYSNIGYSLLGHVVERAGGAPFADHLSSALLTPLGMDSSGFVPPRDAGRLARGYRQNSEGRLLPIRDMPAMGLYTTAEDLSRFITWLFDNSPAPLPPESREAMFEPQHVATALDFDDWRGLGWSLDKGSLRYAGRVARHGGRTPLFTSELIVLPDHGLGVAVLSNAGEGADAVRYLAEAALRWALEEKTGIVPPPAPEPPTIVEAAIPAAAAGRFATEFGVLRVEPADKALVAETLKRRLPLVAYADGTFGAPRPLVADAKDARIQALGHIRLAREQLNGESVLVARYGEKERLFGRAVPAEPVGPDWRNRTGRYRVLNADPQFPVEDLAIRERDGQLYLEYCLPALSDDLIALPLAPVDERLAVILGAGRGAGEFLQIAAPDGRPRLHFSGYEAVPEPGAL